MGKALEITEKTLIPLSLALLIVGFTAWLTRSESRIIYTQQRIEVLETKVQREEDHNFKVQKDIMNKLEDIDKRLSYIQGSLKEKERR